MTKAASSHDLSSTERVAFETLVRLVGFVPQVRFGRATANEHLLRSLVVNENVLYAIYPVQNGGAVLRRGAREYRLLIVSAGAQSIAAAARAAGATRQALHQRSQRQAAPARTDTEKKRKKLRRGSPEFRALMSEVGRENWRKRVRKYGPTGVKPGVTPPWERPGNLAFEKHAAKLARESAQEPKAPEKPLKTF